MSKSKTLDEKLEELDDLENSLLCQRASMTQDLDNRIHEISLEKKKLIEKISEERVNLIKTHIDVLLELVPDHVHSSRQDECSDGDCCNDDADPRDGEPCARCRLVTIRDEPWNADQYDINICVTKERR